MFGRARGPSNDVASEIAFLRNEIAVARALMAKAELKGGTIKEQVLARLRAGIERHERALADLERLRPGARRNPGDPGRT